MEDRGSPIKSSGKRPFPMLDRVPDHQKSYISVREIDLEEMFQMSGAAGFTSIRNSSARRGNFYGRGRPIRLLRRIQDRFNFSIENIRLVQSILQSSCLPLDVPLLQRDITNELADQLGWTIIEELLGNALGEYPGFQTFYYDPTILRRDEVRNCNITLIDHSAAASRYSSQSLPLGSAYHEVSSSSESSHDSRYCSKLPILSDQQNRPILQNLSDEEPDASSRSISCSPLSSVHARIAFQTSNLRDQSFSSPERNVVSGDQSRSRRLSNSSKPINTVPKVAPALSCLIDDGIQSLTAILETMTEKQDINSAAVETTGLTSVLPCLQLTSSTHTSEAIDSGLSNRKLDVLDDSIQPVENIPLPTDGDVSKGKLLNVSGNSILSKLVENQLPIIQRTSEFEKEKSSAKEESFKSITKNSLRISDNFKLLASEDPKSFVHFQNISRMDEPNVQSVDYPVCLPSNMMLTEGEVDSSSGSKERNHSESSKATRTRSFEKLCSSVSNMRSYKKTWSSKTRKKKVKTLKVTAGMKPLFLASPMQTLSSSQTFVYDGRIKIKITWNGSLADTLDRFIPKTAGACFDLTGFFIECFDRMPADLQANLIYVTFVVNKCMELKYLHLINPTFYVESKKSKIWHCCISFNGKIIRGYGRCSNTGILNALGFLCSEKITDLRTFARNHGLIGWKLARKLHNPIYDAGIKEAFWKALNNIYYVSQNTGAYRQNCCHLVYENLQTVVGDVLDHSSLRITSGSVCYDVVMVYKDKTYTGTHFSMGSACLTLICSMFTVREVMKFLDDLMLIVGGGYLKRDSTNRMAIDFYWDLMCARIDFLEDICQTHNNLIKSFFDTKNGVRNAKIQECLVSDDSFYFCLLGWLLDGKMESASTQYAQFLKMWRSAESRCERVINVSRFFYQQPNISSDNTSDAFKLIYSIREACADPEILITKICQSTCLYEMLMFVRSGGRMSEMKAYNLEYVGKVKDCISIGPYASVRPEAILGNSARAQFYQKADSISGLIFDLIKYEEYVTVIKAMCRDYANSEFEMVVNNQKSPYCFELVMQTAARDIFYQPAIEQWKMRYSQEVDMQDFRDRGLWDIANWRSLIGDSAKMPDLRWTTGFAEFALWRWLRPQNSTFTRYKEHGHWYLPPHAVASGSTSPCLLVCSKDKQELVSTAPSEDKEELKPSSLSLSKCKAIVSDASSKSDNPKSAVILHVSDDVPDMAAKSDAETANLILEDLVESTLLNLSIEELNLPDNENLPQKSSSVKISPSRLTLLSSSHNNALRKALMNILNHRDVLLKFASLHANDFAGLPKLLTEEHLDHTNSDYCRVLGKILSLSSEIENNAPS